MAESEAGAAQTHDQGLGGDSAFSPGTWGLSQCLCLTCFDCSLSFLSQGFQGKTGPPGPPGVVGPQVCLPSGESGPQTVEVICSSFPFS